MGVKKSQINTLLLTVLMLSFGSALAEKLNNSESGTQQSNSVFEQWFGWSQRAENSAEKQAKVKIDKHKDKLSGIFTESERSRVLDYYRRDKGTKHKGNGKKNKQKHLPPGLQKKLARGGALPPGWQAKVARGEVLDSEILRHSEPIPDDLARYLPTYSDGEVIRRVGDKVVRVLEGNGTVLDVIDLADVLLR